MQLWTVKGLSILHTDVTDNSKKIKQTNKMKYNYAFEVEVRCNPSLNTKCSCWEGWGGGGGGGGGEGKESVYILLYVLRSEIAY